MRMRICTWVTLAGCSAAIPHVKEWKPGDPAPTCEVHSGPVIADFAAGALLGLVGVTAVGGSTNDRGDGGGLPAAFGLVPVLAGAALIWSGSSGNAENGRCERALQAQTGKSPLPAPPQYYCAAGETIGTCARDAASCERARDVFSAHGRPIGECEVTAEVQCFTAASVEHCLPNAAICQRFRAAAGVRIGPGEVGECAPPADSPQPQSASEATALGTHGEVLRLVGELARDATFAVHAGDCGKVIEIDAKLRALDENLRNDWARDPSIAACLATPK
jgi:hypothetical protein